MARVTVLADGAGIDAVTRLVVSSTGVEPNAFELGSPTRISPAGPLSLGLRFPKERASDRTAIDVTAYDAAGRELGRGTDVRSLSPSATVEYVVLLTPATCGDSRMNGPETDLDCGGGCPAPCAVGRRCATGSDCIEGVCVGGRCTAAVCNDNVENGAETDVDCGGGCTGCLLGKRCAAAADCGTQVCAQGRCSCSTDPKLAATCDSASDAGAAQCRGLSDGNVVTDQLVSCKPGGGTAGCDYTGACAGQGCIRGFLFGFDLGAERKVSRVRFLSDWWSKRPKGWSVWIADSIVGTNLRQVSSSVAQTAPWQCVQDEPCTAEVPDICCPNGRGRPQSLTQQTVMFPKWDEDCFAPTSGRYWFFRADETQDPPSLIMREVEFFGR